MSHIVAQYAAGLGEAFTLRPVDVVTSERG